MVKSLPLFGGFPWIIHIVRHIPMSVLFWALPAGQMFRDFRTYSLACIKEALRVKEENDRKGIKTDDRGSIFLHLANSDMPASERSPERLVKEAQVLLAGGTATTSHTLGYAAVQIMTRPALRDALREELRLPMAEWPLRGPTWADLEKLPLLTAIIKESFRYVCICICVSPPPTVLLPPHASSYYCRPACMHAFTPHHTTPR
jgi:cytochrome P450